jgi:dipeptidyl aminopeptidase/acylaminoacyl peptidase
MKMRSLMIKSRIILSVCWFSWGVTGQAAATGLFQVADLLRLEDLGGDAQLSGGPTYSPDGRSFIYQHYRPLNSGDEVAGTAAWDGLSRSDLWLKRDANSQPQNITDGQIDGSGSWKSFWSPDNQRVAFFSTRGTSKLGIRPRLWLWESATGKIRLLSDRNIMDFGGEGALVWWMGPSHLLCGTFYDSEWHHGVSDSQRATVRATDLWSNIWSGKIATVNIIESGITNVTKTDENPLNVLVMIDTTTGKETVLDEGYVFNAIVSPDGSYAAVLKDRKRTPNREDISNKYLWNQELEACLEIVTGDGRVLSTPHLSAQSITMHTDPAWSSDSKRFAFLGVVSDKDSTNHTAMIYDLAGDQVSPVLCPGVEPCATNNIFCMADENYVLSGKLTQTETKTAKVTNRFDWFLVSPGRRAKNLTASFTNSPEVADFFREAAQDDFICRTHNTVWRVYLDDRPPANLCATVTNSVEKMILPVRQQQWDFMGRERKTAGMEAGTAIVVESKNGATNNYFWLDLTTDQIQPIHKPSPDADLADYSPASGAGVFVDHGRGGDHLWQVAIKESGTASLLAEANTFLADMTEGEQRLIEYQSMDGKPLKGWLLLPANYETGKRYPLVTFVYPGDSYDASRKPANLNEAGILSYFNFQLLAARGYAVLFPSMPLKPDTEADDPLLQLTTGVLPAVDKAVELGIADSGRIGVMGQSFGGYATMGLITQTRRFKAAVSLAGLSDLLSMYDTFGGSVRYEADPNLKGGDFAQVWSMGQGRMMNPPWKDLGRYLRNSPITYVDRVETPLLIFQGDMDYVPIQQGEEFFQALYKQGKRAEFARYWGEGHFYRSPANVEDMWNRVFHWFDTYLKTADAK